MIFVRDRMRHLPLESVTESTPESALWAAVLIQAVDDALNPRPTRCNREQCEMLRRTAWQWFESNAMRIGSFAWVCETLDISPNAVRIAIRQSDALTRLKSRRRMFVAAVKTS